MYNQNKPLKVLFVQHGSTIIGGVERLLLNMVTSYRERGVESLVVVPEFGELVDRLQLINIETRIIACDLFPGQNAHGLNRYLAGTVERAHALIQIIKDENIDIVHTNTVYPFDGALAAALAKIPHIWHIHSLYEQDTIPSLFNAYPLSEQNIKALYSQLANIIVGVSSQALSYFHEFLGNCRYVTIPNGLDISHFDRLSSLQNRNLREILGLGQKTPLVAFIGRIAPQKDPLTFLKAASEILKVEPDTHFIILGPPHDKALYQLVDNTIKNSTYADNFHLLGEREDIPGLLPQFNVFLLTSVFEGQGLVCLEAMAANCPLISTRCGGPEDIVVDGVTGYLVEVGDYKALAEKTVEIMLDSNLANALKLAGRKRLEEHFSWNHFIDQFIDLYSELTVSFDPGQKADPALELCFHFMAKNAELALELEKHETRIAELEGFFERLQNTTIYRIAKYIFRLVGGKTRNKI